MPECDGHPASQPASHVAVAIITLNALAKASSLKTMLFNKITHRKTTAIELYNPDVYSLASNS